MPPRLMPWSENWLRHHRTVHVSLQAAEMPLSSNEKLPRSKHGAEESPFALDTFEEMATAILELDAGACHEVLDHAGD